jgi:hypothetical protein
MMVTNKAINTRYRQRNTRKKQYHQFDILTVVSLIVSHVITFLASVKI